MDRRTNGSVHHAIPAANYTEPCTRKKTRKWSLAGLFKRRRRTKSSDTDSCSECEETKKGFLTLHPLKRRYKYGSHKVVGKFEAIILAKENECTRQKTPIDSIQNYDASPNVIKRYTDRERLPNGQEIEVNDQNSIYCLRSSNGSLNYTSRRTAKESERVKKAKVKLTREYFESSSSDELERSSRTSNGSLQRTDSREGGNRRSRTARTERYIKRHSKEFTPNPNTCCLKSDSGLSVPLNPTSRWLTPGYTMKTQSVTSSPLSSPASLLKNFQCSSLPRKYDATSLDACYDRWDALSKTAPLPPPHKVCNVDPYSRPSSYAFEGNIKLDYRGGMRRKSNSDAELLRRRQCHESSSSTYCTDQSPRSRNPVQLVDEGTIADHRPAYSRSAPLKRYYNSDLSLNRANEIGVLAQATIQQFAPARRRERPPSAVSGKSGYQLQCTEAQQLVKDPKKNLEEALLELEQIYNSLRLSDEDLPDRAERRDLQSAIRTNLQFARSRNDSEGSADESPRMANERRMVSPRLKCRRSATPDTVTDDMAFRKLNKRKRDPKSNSNLVSQSGSFMLMSPTLSPTPLVDVAPVVGPLFREPDITFDDVVYRNITQTNNKLRVCDPQPPFGIPLGPVSPASISDYLHAVPGEKYRSRFNPSRIPDIVKDDLAFRNLRKDVRYRDIEKQVELVAEQAKKCRAMRSLPANVDSLMRNQRNTDEDTMLDVNCNHLRDRSVCFNNLPDILEMQNCHKCSDQDEACRRDAGKEYNLSSKWSWNSDAFRRRVAVHKPITLNQFEIADGRNQQIRSTRSISHNSSRILSSCQNGALYHAKLTDCDDITKPDNFENSSSGICSTSESKPSCKGESNFVSNVYSSPLLFSTRLEQPTRYVTEVYVDKGVTPSSSEESVRGVGDCQQSEHHRENTESCRKCKRIEITLSTAQPAGSTVCPIIPLVMSNINVLVFAAIYIVACLQHAFFTSFSVMEVALLVISLFVYCIHYRR